MTARAVARVGMTNVKERGDHAVAGTDGQEMIDVSKSGDEVIFQVRVQPRASRDEVAGEMQGAMKVRLQAPAVEDRANEALCEYLAVLLKRPKSAVRILSGERSRIKRIAIRGVSESEIRALLTYEA